MDRKAWPLRFTGSQVIHNLATKPPTNHGFSSSVRDVRCESSIVRKTEHWRNYAFKLWCWRRLLRGPWTARRSNQSILKEISPKYSLEGRTDDEAETPIILATWCKELTHWKRTWCWDLLWVGAEGNDRRWDGWMASPTLWTWVWASSGSWLWTREPCLLQSMGWQRIGHTEWLNWTVTSPPGICKVNFPYH